MNQEFIIKYAHAIRVMVTYMGSSLFGGYIKETTVFVAIYETATEITFMMRKEERYFDLKSLNLIRTLYDGYKCTLVKYSAEEESVQVSIILPTLDEKAISHLLSQTIALPENSEKLVPVIFTNEQETA